MVKRHLPLLLVTLVATGLFELFFHFDWDSGVVRAGVVVALLGLMLFARALGRGRTRSAWPRWMLVVSSVVVALLVYWHFKEGLLSTWRQRRSEMGDIHVRTVRLLREGISPWGFGTVLESGAFRYLIRDPASLACRAGSPPPDEAQQATMWDSPSRGDELFPERITAPGCEYAHALLAVVGYRYGPAMIAAYVPLIGALGRGGEYVTHLLFLLAILGALAVLLRPLSREGLLMACVVLLGQSVLRWDTLYESDCDLIPTAMMLWALVAFEKGRFGAAGALAALTLAAKVFPAVFLLPLLIQDRRGRAAGAFLAVSALSWGPAFAVDGVGVWDNVFRFNLERAGDSTALSFFAPPAVMLAVRLGVVASCALAFWRFVLRPGAFEPMAFVAFCMGPFFVFSKVFHNNYLVWWLPVVGVVLARALTAPRAASRPATAPAASSTPAG